MEIHTNAILDDALVAWRRSAKDETLSRVARTALFDDVRSLGDGSGVTFVPGLTRAWRWAFLGSVPVVAIAAVLMVAGDHRPASPPRLSASKVDGQVIFTLANGKTDHLV